MIICCVTDGHAPTGDNPSDERATVLEIINRAVAAGVDWLQIREKNYPPRELTTLAREALKIVATAHSSARIIINDRLDAAVASGADGIHLGGDTLPLREVVQWRMAKGADEGPPASGPSAFSNFLIGKSCHSLDEVRQAKVDGADYVFFGPVFFTPSKARYGLPQGVGRLAEVCRATDLPVLAIGGVTPENAPDCLQAGAAGIAAIRLFQNPKRIAALIRRIRQ